MTHRIQFYNRHKINKNKSLSLKEISDISSISLKDIKEIFDRGIGAHETNPASVRLKGSFKKDPSAPISKKLSAEQWAYARVYSFINKIDLIKDGDLKYLNQDCDIGKKYISNVKCKK